MNASQLIPLLIGLALALPLAILLIWGVALFAISLFVPRHRMILKMGLRNIARRRAQTLLIISGLTLSTTIITSALGIGDTMRTSVRDSGTKALGKIDHIISQDDGELSAAHYAELRDQLAAEPRIAGLTAAVRRPVAVVDQRSGQGEPLAALLAVGPEFDTHFGLTAAPPARVADLAAGEVYLNRAGADKLGAEPGDALQIYAGPQPLELKVRAIVGDEGLVNAGSPIVVLPLAEAQRLLSLDGAVSEVLIAAKDGAAAELTERLRISLLDEAVAQELIATLRTPEVSAALAAEHKSITDNDYLKEKLGQLQAELKAAGTSDALRSLLADGRVGRALLGLNNLPATTQESLAAQLGGLSELRVDDAKADAIADAEEAGADFSQIFLVFSTFSILAGVLLVFLIFVMLAAERKSEMGMARAVGMKRRHLIQMFVTEGAIYDLLAALVGVGLGVAISYAMVGVISGALGSFSETGGLKIVYSVQPTSLVLSYVIGVVLTFLVVTFSSWRVSRLNIVAAIRDLPEEMEGKISLWRRLWRWSRGLLLLGLGALLSASGYAGESQLLVGVGVSLGLIGAGLTLGMLLSLTPLRAAVRDRLVYTLLGVALLVLWLLPFDTRDALLGTAGYEQSEAIFFLAGLMMISGAIWVIVYNADLLLGLLNRVFGRFGNAAPILKTATSYPLAARFRTGMALAMFALVMFTIIAMVVVVQVNEQFFARRDEMTAGFDLQANVLESAAISDLNAELAANPAITREDIEGTAALATLPMEIRQVGGSSPVWYEDRLVGFDEGFVDQARQHYAFHLRAPGYADDAAIWQALRERDDVIVLSSSEVHYDAADAAEPARGRFYLEGATWQDKTMPATQVELRDPRSGTTRTLTVIGVIEEGWFEGIQGNRSVIAGLSGQPARPDTFLIKVRDGASHEELARALEKAFLTRGMNVVAFQQLFDEIQQVSRSLNNLLLGFVALGLVVGIAALGVISSRSVVERRQQIGMLRAIGYKQRMVWLSFMIESSFISLLGIAIGTTFGLVLAWLFISDFAKDQPGLAFQPPWLTVGSIIVGAYLCSLVTTILPARKAARIYPAEALRYE